MHIQQVRSINPYSEPQFKTLKYRPDFPTRFASIEAARQHCQTFFAWSRRTATPASACTFPPTSTTAPPTPSATNAPACSPQPSPPTPNGSSADHPSHQRYRPAPGSTHPPTARRPLNRSCSTVPHSGRFRTAQSSTMQTDVGRCSACQPRWPPRADLAYGRQRPGAQRGRGARGAAGPGFITGPDARPGMLGKLPRTLRASCTNLAEGSIWG